MFFGPMVKNSMKGPNKEVRSPQRENCTRNPTAGAVLVSSQVLNVLLSANSVVPPALYWESFSYG
jgi:hypothetical protein